MGKSRIPCSHSTMNYIHTEAFIDNIIFSEYIELSSRFTPTQITMRFNQIFMMKSLLEVLIIP